MNNLILVLGNTKVTVSIHDMSQNWYWYIKCILCWNILQIIITIIFKHNRKHYSAYEAILLALIWLHNREHIFLLSCVKGMGLSHASANKTGQKDSPGTTPLHFCLPHCINIRSRCFQHIACRQSCYKQVGGANKVWTWPRLHNT